MRINAGLFSGRIFQPPKGHRTHPMGDRVKTALFNTLGDITSLSVLDAYGGSGALAFEAVSRGAASAYCIDVDKHAYETIVANIQSLGLQNTCKAVRANVSSWSDNNQLLQFDIVLLDPPHDQVSEATLNKIASRHCVSHGIVVVCIPADMPTLDLADFQEVKNKTFAGARLVFYRRLS